MNTCILSDSTKSIKGKLGGSATTNPTFTSHYYDSLQSNIAEDFNDGAFNGTTSVDLVPAPSSGHRRIVKEITIYNGDSNDQTIELVIDNNGSETVIWKQVVKAGSVAYVFQPSVVATGEVSGGGTSLEIIDPITANTTLTEEHANKYIPVNSASAVNITIDSAVFEANNSIVIEQAGAGMVEIIAGTDMTLNGPVKTWGQYSVIEVFFKLDSVATVIGGSE